MKRTLVVLALLLAVGITLTFADDAAKPAGITIGSWARSIYAPLASRDSDMVPGMGVSWGNATRVGYVIKADSDTAGFYLTLCADAHSFGVTDDISVYVKPLPGLKVAGGSPYDDTLRNNGAAFGSWNWVRANAIYGEDFGFDRVNGSNCEVAEVSYNANGIFVYFEQSRPKGNVSFTKYGESVDSATDAMNNIAFGAGYTIAGMGQIKAQKLGYASTGSNYGLYEIGFNVSAVPNLSAEADIKLPTDNKKSPADMQIPVSGSYKVDKATINAFAVATMLNDQSPTGKKTAIGAGGGVDYDIGDGLGFTSDLRYNDKYDAAIKGNASGKAQVEFFVGVNKSLAVGQIGVGFEYVTTGGFGGADLGTGIDATKAQWCVPIKWEVSF
jgi:hypothetical protein